MKKIPIAVFSLFLGISCGNHTGFFPVFIWMTILYTICIALYHAYSLYIGNTKYCHEYIGWTWIIIPICFTMYMLLDIQTAWNRLWIFVGALCIELIILRIWNIDLTTETKCGIITRGAVCLLIAGMISFSIMGLNESVIRSVEYDYMTLEDKDTYSSTQSFFDRDSYYLYFSYKYGDIRIDEMKVSKEYYSSLQIGDIVPICFCTGLLGKEFYFLYEETDSKWDYYGLNEWAREKAQEEQVQIE